MTTTTTTTPEQNKQIANLLKARVDELITEYIKLSRAMFFTKHTHHELITMQNRYYALIDEIETYEKILYYENLTQCNQF